MQEEEDEDDIYAPDDFIPGLSTPAPTLGGGGGTTPPKVNDELEEGEEEDEEMEEDYGESDSVGVFFLLFVSFFLCRIYSVHKYYYNNQVLLSQNFIQQ